MKISFLWIAVFVFLALLPPDLYSQGFRRFRNTQSNLDFFATNKGVLFNNDAIAGLNWPRGTVNSYIFGGGLWFAAKKLVGNTWTKMCELGFNPNSGAGWFTQGESNSLNDENDPKGKYNSYLSTSFNQITGLPTKHDSSTPQYRWPVWTPANKAGSIKTNFNFGTRISSVTERDSLAALGEKPVFISQEDILNTYSDFDSTANPEFQSGTGYPLELIIHESIYSWGFGRYQDIIFIRYEVKNSSKDTLKDCFLAPAFDPDLGVGGASAAGNDINSYFGLRLQDTTDCRNFFPTSSPYHSDPGALNLVRQWSKTESTANPPGEYGCIGFAFVETPVVASGAIINSDDSIKLDGYGTNSLYQKNRLGLSSFRQWTISNDPRSPTRYDFVGSGNKDHDNSIVADMRIIMSTGPFTIAPGGSVTATIAIGIARPSITVLKNNLDSLLKLMAFAHEFFENPISQSSDPNSITIHHFEGAPTVSVKQSPILPELDITIFPNPASGIITIQNAPSGDFNITVLNILGETVMQVNNVHSSDFRLDLSKLLRGTYYIRFASAHSVATKMVVVEK